MSAQGLHHSVLQQLGRAANFAPLQAHLFKAEKDKLARALAKELGEETPLSKALEGGGDWRGRAQQISLLKAKLGELQQAQVGHPPVLHAAPVHQSEAQSAIWTFGISHALPQA